MLSSSNPKWKTQFFTPPFLVPGAPPSMVNAYPESSSSLRIVWEPPPENKQNGIISYYKIFIVPKTRSDSEATVIEIKNPRAREFVIDELLKWTQYRIWMLAGTSVGDGPKSAPIDIKTDEDGRYHFYDKYRKNRVVLTNTVYFCCILQNHSILIDKDIEMIIEQNQWRYSIIFYDHLDISLRGMKCTVYIYPCSVMMVRSQYQTISFLCKGIFYWNRCLEIYCRISLFPDVINL